MEQKKEYKYIGLEGVIKNNSDLYKLVQFLDKNYDFFKESDTIFMDKVYIEGVGYENIARLVTIKVLRDRKLRLTHYKKNGKVFIETMRFIEFLEFLFSETIIIRDHW